VSKFEGVITALVTPFQNGEVDLKSLKKLIRHQIENGVQGFVVNGTTGESPTLRPAERKLVLEFVKGEVGGQIPVIMGTGTNNTETTIANTRDAETWNADGVLVVTPYYNKPPQRGLVAHFKAVAAATRLPVILYNVPGRTACSLSIESVVELASVPNIVGIKEASGDLEMLEQLVQQCPKDFLLLSGDDDTYLEFMKLGGHGVISVLSHVIPKQMGEMNRTAKNSTHARELFAKYRRLTKLLFCEANPIPVKAAVQAMGLIEKDDLRLPLVSLADNLRSELVTEMKALGVL
jgi:4-hydroxy-tetrahydrodipicolinate synthase